jgi:uncharacterized protein
MLKEEILKIIDLQKIKLKKDLIDRDVKLKFTSQITIISGIRRCGKSTLLNQTLKDVKDLTYLNFEDFRLKNFKLNDFDKLPNTKYYFFDEIQNIPEWERYVRFAHDNGKKIFITCSNASMLSRELGTKLTGRYKLIELYPFSYKEYLKYLNKKLSKESFQDYMFDGGFPEYLKEKDPEYLQRLLENIIARDILVRKGLKNEATITNLMNFLISNVGKIFSYNNVSKKLSIKSVRTTIDYCKYLQESYLIELIPNFSKSITKQIVNPKKVYAIDTGLIKINSLSFSQDLGRVLENIVFINLRKKYSKIFYFNEEGECDFLIKDKNEIILAFQVCYELNQDNKKREINGLKEAMKKTGCKKGMILTLDQEDEEEGTKIIPVWKWLTEG